MPQTRYFLTESHSIRYNKPKNVLRKPQIKYQESLEDIEIILLWEGKKDLIEEVIADMCLEKQADIIGDRS